MVEAWYDESIGKIRFTAQSGGEALTVKQAEKRMAMLQKQIDKAKND